jgi:hypothetical protein
MKFFNRIFGKKKSGICLDIDTQLLLEKSKNITVELCFLDPRKEELPIDKILALVKNENLGLFLDKWSIGITQQYSLQKGFDLAYKMNQKKFQRITHALYQGEYLIPGSGSLTFSIVVPFILPGTYRVRWHGKRENLDMEIFEDLMTDKEFVCAYAFWEMDDFIQNTSNVQPYQFRNIPYDKTRVIKATDRHSPDDIDIDGNPGRSRQVQNMMLRSCWRMWFSDNYFRLIPREKLQAFDGAYHNEQLSNGLQFIELYENPYDANKLTNRQIQKRFNEWIGIEEIYEYQKNEFGARF